jgi:hypothetical protein
MTGERHRDRSNALARVKPGPPLGTGKLRKSTKGRVERMVRELMEGFLGWLSGQLLPP